MQFNIGQVNEDGVYTGSFDTIALCGFVRSRVSTAAGLELLRLCADVVREGDLFTSFWFLGAMSL